MPKGNNRKFGPANKRFDIKKFFADNERMDREMLIDGKKVKESDLFRRKQPIRRDQSR